MSPRTRAPQRDEDVLLAAREVFLEKGFDGATMLEIATRAQVGKGTLYAVAPSKQDLFLRVVFDSCQRMVSEVSHVLTGSRSTPDKLGGMVDAFVGEMDEQAPFFWLSLELLSRAHRDERLGEDVFAGFRALYAQFFGPVISLIESAQERGELGDCHAEGVARLLGAIIDGLIFQSMFEGERMPRREIAETLARLLRHGLQAQEEIL